MLDDVDDQRLDGSALRERRRARTAREIEHAALRLFADRGYHEVTVDEIAHAADISERTFFRYFASKDDVLMAEWRRRMDALCDFLAARDPVEPAWQAMHNALIELVRSVEGDDAAALWNRVTAEVPYLRARVTAHAAEVNATVIAGLLAARVPVDQDGELVLEVMAQSMMGASYVAYRRWINEPHRSLVALNEEALRAVEQGFARRASGRTVA
jgi:AcrR family transcriptional regulator